MAEEHQGLSEANRATWDHAVGDIPVYTDEDGHRLRFIAEQAINRLIDAARKEGPSEPLASGVGREEVARVIDPLWAQLADEIARVESLCDQPSPAYMVACRANRDERGAKALAKADQVLALIASSPGGFSSGDQRLSSLQSIPSGDEQ